MFSDPEVSIADVVYVLQTDPALSGKILKAANTSQFGLRKPVSDLQRAVVLLGKKSVMALALGFSLAEASMSTGPHADLYSDFWFQSLVRGCAASVLAETYSDIDAGEAFTLGLLSRIGRLALLNCDTERYVACLKRADESGRPLDEIESEELEITSHVVTLHLFEEWKLPEHCVQAIDQMSLSLDEACANRCETVSLGEIIRIATAFGEFFSGENCGLAIAKVYELCCTILGEPESEVNVLVDRIRADLDDHSDLFSVDMSKVGSPLELLSQAMGQLSLMAVSASMPQESGQKSHDVIEENGRLRRRVLELTQSTLTDPLTGLANRTSLMQQLRERTAQALVNQTHVSLLFLDVDHFKEVNDSYGHLVGDDVLKVVANVLLDDLTDGDVAARFGGEEFVILTSATDPESLDHQANSIRQRIESRSITCGKAILRVTVSIGGAVCLPSPEEDGFVEAILEAADGAMYESKRKGRNRTTIIDSIQGTGLTSENQLQPS